MSKIVRLARGTHQSGIPNIDKTTHGSDVVRSALFAYVMLVAGRRSPQPS